jgi:hypothetical protein
MDRIDHPSAIDIGGGRMGFRSKDTVAGVAGTVVTATHMNASQEEIVGAIEAAGFTPDGDDLGQLAQAIQQGLNFAVATGTANAWVIELPLAPLAYRAGLSLDVVPPATNTSTTVNADVDGLGNRRIKKRDGTDPAIGDLVGGVAYPTLDDGTTIRIMAPLPSDIVGATQGRARILTASGSFTIPAGVTTVEVQCWGGGGGGGASGSGGNGGGGGSAGGYSHKLIAGLTPGGTIAVTVGAGGSAGASATGGTGGTSSFGAHCSASGGGGGLTGNNIYSGSGSPGSGTGGDLNIAGGQGGPSGPGAGAGFDPAYLYNLASRGGVPAFASGIVGWFGSGLAGVGFGSGGGGATGGSGLAGGAGAPGLVIVRW